MDVTRSAAILPGFLKLLAHELRWKILTQLARSDYSVAEIVQFLDQPQNVVSYHLKKLRDQRLVTERRSSADGRDVYYSLDLETFRSLYLAAGETLHPALGQAGTATVSTFKVFPLSHSPFLPSLTMTRFWGVGEGQSGKRYEEVDVEECQRLLRAALER
jgi:DNA-binding transcriptional ArsR family regulator